MDESRKQKLLILGFVLFIVVMAGALYFVFFRSSPEPVIILNPENPNIVTPNLPSSGTVVIPPQPPTQPPTTGDTPTPTTPVDPTEGLIPTAPSETANGGPTLANVISFSNNPTIIVNKVQGGINAYDPTDGAFVRYDANGNSNFLSDKRFYNLSSLKWSPTGTGAIMSFADNSQIYFDFSRNTAVRLPEQIKEPAFNPTGDKIAFKWKDSIDPDRNYIGISRPDGSSVRFIEPLGTQSDNFNVQWSADEKYIATFRTGKNLGAQEIYFVGQNQENFRTLVVPGLNFEYQYAPVGNTILYSTVDLAGSANPVLYVTTVGQENLSAGVNTGLSTTPDKCAFSPTGLVAYCSVPRNLPRGAGLVPALATSTIDDIYRVDIKTGATSLLAQPIVDGQQNQTVRNLAVSEDEKTLFFTGANGELLSLKL